ncbi:MAG: ribosome silencing factor [Bacteroidetes bacterium]|nr:ribosome silencing factor [Bacteroidota bacterium]MBT3935954.1 ribosome silencing factor [Bacteroidota bacterium]MBT4967681.1 ribosome silencing factor [Bacteroidota bacterium]MBT5991984.1 ribosome silencing factor [Bacteroidota bacterium]
MISKVNEQDLEILKKSIIKGMLDKKASNITSIDLRKGNNSLADLFIVCHGTSNRQVEAIAENVEEEVFKTTGEKVKHKEGYTNKEWILLDYFDIIVHVFSEEKREFFALEKLWGDGEIEVHASENIII